MPLVRVIQGAAHTHPPHQCTFQVLWQPQRTLLSHMGAYFSEFDGFSASFILGGNEAASRKQPASGLVSTPEEVSSGWR